MQKFILDKSYLRGLSGEKIANDESLVICPSLLYEILKETTNSDNPERLNINNTLLNKLYLKSHIDIIYVSLNEMLKYEDEKLMPYDKDFLGTIDCKQFKEACINISRNDMNEERDFITKFTAIIATIALNKHFYSIFHEKSKDKNVTVEDVTLEKVNEHFKDICLNKKHSPLIINEKWVTYFYYKSILSFAIKIHDNYSQTDIEKIVTLINNVITLPKNNDDYNNHMKEIIVKINNIETKDAKEIHNSITHHLLDYIFLIYASLIGGIKSKDKNINEVAKHWNIQTI